VACLTLSTLCFYLKAAYAWSGRGKPPVRWQVGDKQMYRPLFYACELPPILRFTTYGMSTRTVTSAVFWVLKTFEIKCKKLKIIYKRTQRSSFRNNNICFMFYILFNRNKTTLGSHQTRFLGSVLSRKRILVYLEPGEPVWWLQMFLLTVLPISLSWI